MLTYDISYIDRVSMPFYSPQAKTFADSPQLVSPHAVAPRASKRRPTPHPFRAVALPDRKFDYPRIATLTWQTKLGKSMRGGSRHVARLPDRSWPQQSSAGPWFSFTTTAGAEIVVGTICEMAAAPFFLLWQESGFEPQLARFATHFRVQVECRDGRAAFGREADNNW